MLKYNDKLQIQTQLALMNEEKKLIVVCSTVWENDPEMTGKRTSEWIVAWLKWIQNNQMLQWYIF